MLAHLGAHVADASSKRIVVAHRGGHAADASSNRIVAGPKKLLRAKAESDVVKMRTPRSAISKRLIRVNRKWAG